MGASAFDELMKVLHRVGLLTSTRTEEITRITNALEPDEVKTIIRFSTQLVRQLGRELQPDFDEYLHTLLDEELTKPRRYTMDPPALLDVDGVAKHLGVSVRTVERLIAEGELMPLWIRNQRRFTIDGVDTFLRTCPGGKPKRRHRRKGNFW